MKYLSFNLVALAALSLTSIANAQTAKSDIVKFGKPQTLTIQSGEKTHDFSVEVAKTLRQQARGLMFRDSLPETSGMLFEFDEPKIATIWMKNTSIPLDVLFVRSNGKILKIEHSHQPYTLRSASSEAVVAAVVELKGGEARSRGISPGDQIIHPFFK